MSITEQLAEVFAEIDESLDLSSASANVLVRAGETVTFPSVVNIGGKAEDVVGALKVEDIHLIEASLRSQERGGAGMSGDFFETLELTFALPGARVGIMEGDEFAPLPIYGSEKWARVVQQTPLVFGQLMRANSEVTGLGEDSGSDSLYGWLADLGYIHPKRFVSPAQEGSTSRIWTLEADNRQTGEYRTDLPERVRNGVDVVEFTVVPPNDPERNGFKDFLRATLDNVQRIAMHLREGATPEERKEGSRLMSSLTGVTTQDEGGPWPQRATVPAFTASVQTGRSKWADQSFSFWSSSQNGEANGQGAQAEPAGAVE